MGTSESGSGASGIVAEVLSKLKEPLFMLNFIAFVLSIMAVSSVSSADATVSVNGTTTSGCAFNFNAHTCSFNVSVNVGAMISALVFLAVDFYWDKFENTSKTIYMVQSLASAVISLIYVIGFFMMVANWGPASDAVKSQARGAAGFAMAVEFACALVWLLLAWLVYKAFKSDDGSVSLGFSFRGGSNAYEDIDAPKRPAYKDPVTGASEYQAPAPPMGAGAIVDI